MSEKAVKFVLQQVFGESLRTQDIKSLDRLLMIAVARRMREDKHHVCLRNDELAFMTCTGVDSIKRAKARLKNAGFLTVELRHNLTRGDEAGGTEVWYSFPGFTGK